MSLLKFYINKKNNNIDGLKTCCYSDGSSSASEDSIYYEESVDEILTSGT